MEEFRTADIEEQADTEEEMGSPLPALELEEKKMCGAASVLLVLLALAVGFAAGRWGSMLLPQRDAGPDAEQIWLLSEYRHYTGGETEPESVTRYEYDGGGRVVSIRTENGGVLVSHSESSYDENGNCLSTSEYDDSGALSWGMENTYDERGNVLTDRVRYSDGTGYESSYAYDDEGNITQTIRADADGNIEWRSEKVIVQLADGSCTEQTIEYDAADNCTGSSLYTYDAADNMIRSEERYPEGGCEVWEYDYFVFSPPAADGTARKR